MDPFTLLRRCVEFVSRRHPGAELVCRGSGWYVAVDGEPQVSPSHGGGFSDPLDALLDFTGELTITVAPVPILVEDAA